MFKFIKALFSKRSVVRSDSTSDSEEIGKDDDKSIRFLAGERAENMFEIESRETPWVAERINQSKESFASYNSHSSEGFVKRGDFIFRKFPLNIEVEVKCFTPFKRGRREFFKIPYRQWKGHQEMIKAFDLDDVVFAFYERDGDSPKNGSLRMASMNYITNENRKSGKHIYWKSEQAMMIPLNMTRPGFEVLRILERRATKQSK